MAKSVRTRKTQTIPQDLRLRRVSPLTETQRMVFEAYGEGMNLFLYGCAGTGKSLCALYLATKEVMQASTPYNRVIIVRSAVPSRDLGFLPGTPKEKLEVYEPPYINMINWLFERGDAWKIAQAKGIVEMKSTSFLRGLTLDGCIVIVDEIQNMNYEELKTIITRMGNNSKIMFCGDTSQNDLYRKSTDKSGMREFYSVVEQMESMEAIEFMVEDVVRGGLCKEFICAEHRIQGNGLYRAKLAA